MCHRRLGNCPDMESSVQGKDGVAEDDMTAEMVAS